MKKVIVLSVCCSAIALFYSCKKNMPDASSGGTVYLDLPAKSYSYYSLPTQDTAQNNNIATLGRVLFYDAHLSINNSVSCGSCHKQAVAFGDNVALSRGYENRLTARNSMPIQNLGSGSATTLKTMGVAATGRLFWDAREISTTSLVARPISNHVEMGINDLSTLPAKLAQLPYYKNLFKSAYGTEAITEDGISVAISTFMCAITATNTRLDQSYRNKASLTALELKGQILFSTIYPCSNCHQVQSTSYANDLFNIGLDYPNVDKGVGAITGVATDMGKFKIPSLRNVALTAPYMHDGRFATLDDVLEHYSHGIQNDPNLDPNLLDVNGQPLRMNISTDDKKAIIAFLGTLTDYSMITDEKFSNPFKTK